MRRRKNILAFFGFCSFLMLGVSTLNNVNANKASVMTKADGDVTLTGGAALACQVGNGNFAFTINGQDSVTTKNSVKFTIQNPTSITLTRDGRTYYPGSGTESSLFEKSWLKDGIDGFIFSFKSAWFNGTDVKDGDVLTFDNTQIIRQDDTVKNVVTITKSVFTYSANEGWGSDNGTVSGLSFTVNDPSSKGLRFKASTMPQGLTPKFADYRMYYGADDTSGIFINNIRQDSTAFTFLSGNVFYTAFAGTTIYDIDSSTSKPVARSSFKENDVIRIEGKFQLSLKDANATGGREKENSYFTFERTYIQVKNGKFEVVNPTVYEAEFKSVLYNNDSSLWLDLGEASIPDDTVLTIPRNDFSIVRSGAILHPAADTLNNKTFIHNRSDTMPGYFLAVPSCWWGGTNNSPQKGDRFEFSGDAYYIDSDNNVVVIRIKPFTLDYNGSTYSPDHVPSATGTFSEDCSTCTFLIKCSVCGYVIGQETVTPISSTVEATCEKGSSTLYHAEVVVGGKTYTAEKTIENGEALGHIFTEPTYSWNDDNSSCTAYRKCTRQGCNYVEEEVVEPTKDVSKEATCSEAGKATLTATFENKAFVTQIKEVELPIKNHDFRLISWSWNSSLTSASALVKCHECELEKEIEATITQEICQKQSCTKEELTAYTATVSFENLTYIDTKINKTKDPAGHHYESVSWTWEKDHLSAVCKSSCSECGYSLTKDIDATISRVEPTSEKEGKITYSVSITLNGQTFSDKYEEVLPKVEKKSGCGGSVIASSGILFTLSLAGVSLILIKKKH